jgi:hypothetical protein
MATLIMYIYVPDANFGMAVPAKTKVLAAKTKFDLLSFAIDFSGVPGLELHIYYGYVLDSTIQYNAYLISVGRLCDSVPDCHSLTDASSCDAASGCEWSLFPTPQCSLKCSQFTSQAECLAGFGGDGACVWNHMFSACAEGSGSDDSNKPDCGSITGIRSCNMTDGCEWDSLKEECVAD